MSKNLQLGVVCAAVSLMASAGLAQDHKDPSSPSKQQSPPATPGARADRSQDQTRARTEQPGEMQRWLSKLEGKWDVTIESNGPLAGTSSPSSTGTSETAEVTAANGDRVNTPSSAATGSGLGSPKPDDNAKPDQRAAKSTDGKTVNSTGHGSMKTVMMFGGRHAHSWVRAECDGKSYEGMGVLAYNDAARRFESTWTDNMHTGVGFMSGQLDADRKTLTLTGDSVDPETGSNVRCREVMRWVADDRYVSEFYQTGSDGSETRKMTLTFVRTGKPDQVGDWENPWMKSGKIDNERSDRSRPAR